MPDDGTRPPEHAERDDAGSRTQGVGGAGAEADGADERRSAREDVEEPARLLRIAATVQTMFHEVRATELDEAARERLTEIHNQSVAQLREVVSPELEAELDGLTFDLDGTPSGSELRVMQAQLTGWLQGLFHGIQASMASEAMAAREAGSRPRRSEAPALNQPGTGQYL